ncbi:MAG: UDP-3-O-(3-hydroxymyristoyl)glucosamine N-acyltransferase [Pseudomonadota bacterium]
MTLTVALLAQALQGEAVGDASLPIGRPSAPEDAGRDDLVVAMDRRYAKGLERCPSRVALLWPGADWHALGFEAAIFVRRARLALADLTGRFETPDLPEAGIHPLAAIDPTAEIGPDAAIGPFVRIGAGVRIGPGASIAAHCSIGRGAALGCDSILHEGVRIGTAVAIGDRFRAQPGAVIGADGFSFVTPERGAVEAARSMERSPEVARAAHYRRIASLGAVRIGDDVEVGANSCVDRGTLTDTRIGSGTKIDNLVQIGHNVEIGETCLICGQAGVAGSVQIGDRVVLGGQTGVADNLKIGSDVLVAAQSGVGTNLKGPGVYMAAPAVPRDRAAKMLMLMRRLPELFDRVAALQKAVSNRKSNG